MFFFGNAILGIWIFRQYIRFFRYWWGYHLRIARDLLPLPLTYNNDCSGYFCVLRSTTTLSKKVRLKHRLWCVSGFWQLSSRSWHWVLWSYVKHEFPK